MINNLRNKMLKSVNTYRGMKKIDTELKLVENNNGEMVSYIEVKPYPVDGVPHFAYIHSGGKSATVLTTDGHRKANEISDEQKAINLKEQRVASVMSEGYGDY